MDCSHRRRFASPFCSSSRTSQIHKDERPFLNINDSRLSSSKALSEHKLGMHLVDSEEYAIELEEHSQLYSAPIGPNSQDMCIGKKRVYAPAQWNINEELSIPEKKRMISYRCSDDEELDGSNGEVNRHGLCPGSMQVDAHDSYSGKPRMIRGYSVPRCGRASNQSYHEQAKEFEAILSSKVRQIAEVADCLQHKEVLYRILQM